MVVYENLFIVQSEFSVQTTTKSICSHGQTIKITCIYGPVEVSAPPAGCEGTVNILFRLLKQAQKVKTHWLTGCSLLVCYHPLYKFYPLCPHLNIMKTNSPDFNVVMYFY